MAEYYSAELSQKIRRGMDINAEKCLSNGSNPGLGYYVDEERRFHVDRSGAAVVREIFEMYASGKTVAEITKYLNAKQVKTSQGKEFNKNSLHRLLRNKRYIGYYIYKDTETSGGMPRIMEDELFQRVQHILDRNKKSSRPFRGARGISADDKAVLRLLPGDDDWLWWYRKIRDGLSLLCLQERQEKDLPEESCQQAENRR